MCVCVYVCVHKKECMYVMYDVCVSSASERGYVWIVMQCNRASIYLSAYLCVIGLMYVCMYVCAYVCSVRMNVSMLCIVYVCHLRLSEHICGL